MRTLNFREWCKQHGKEWPAPTSAFKEYEDWVENLVRNSLVEGDHPWAEVAAAVNKLPTNAT